MKFPLLVAAAIALSQAAHGQTSLKASGLTEALIAPCNHLLAFRSQFYPQDYNKDPLDLSNLDFARTIPPYLPLYDRDTTQLFMDVTRANLAALESRSAERMQQTIGTAFSGAEYDDRLARDRRFYCLLKVREGQLTGKKPDFRDLPPPPAAAPPSASITIVLPGSDFDTKLKTLGAGELFVFADELDQQGKPDQARAARRALIARFPDSQLAGTAAQQLAASPR